MNWTGFRKWNLSNLINHTSHAGNKRKYWIIHQYSQFIITRALEQNQQIAPNKKRIPERERERRCIVRQQRAIYMFKKKSIINPLFHIFFFRMQITLLLFSSFILYILIVITACSSQSKPFINRLIYIVDNTKKKNNCIEINLVHKNQLKINWRIV